jgi:hypothetical protein
MTFYLKRKEFLQTRNNNLVQIAGDKSDCSPFAPTASINRYSIIASPSFSVYTLFSPARTDSLLHFSDERRRIIFFSGLVVICQSFYISFLSYNTLQNMRTW